MSDESESNEPSDLEKLEAIHDEIVDEYGEDFVEEHFGGKQGFLENVGIEGELTVRVIDEDDNVKHEQTQNINTTER